MVFRVAAGCQEMAENSVDGPHFRYVHHTAIVPEIQSYETEGTRVADALGAEVPDAPRRGGRPHRRGQPGSRASPPPASAASSTPCSIGAAVPVDAVTSEVRFSFKTRSLGDAEATSTVGQAFVAEVCKQFEEDRPIWENKAHIVRPALADTDPPFMKFRKWYAQFYAEGIDTSRGVWSPPAPPGDGQPVFIRPEGTASARYTPNCPSEDALGAAGGAAPASPAAAGARTRAPGR